MNSILPEMEEKPVVPSEPNQERAGQPGIDRIKAGEKKSAEASYNEAVSLHEKNEIQKALELYQNAINASGNQNVSARAFQNIGVIMHNQARELMKKMDIENASKILDHAEEMYRQALASENHHEDVPLNQQKLLNDRKIIEEMKKQKQEMQNKKQEAQDKTKDAKDKNQEARDEQKNNGDQKQDDNEGSENKKQPDPQNGKNNKEQSENAKNEKKPEKQDGADRQSKNKQEEAREKTEAAQKAVEDYRNEAEKQKSEEDKKAAEKAREELEKAREEQKRLR